MKTFFIVALLFAGVVLADYGRVDTVTVDLAKRTAAVNWTWTESTDMTCRMRLMRDGDDFPADGWAVKLFIGNGDKGLTLEGTSAFYNEVLFPVRHRDMPTNGTYAVQIIAEKDARAEEWARGQLHVRLNPAADAIPETWNDYRNLIAEIGLKQHLLPYPTNAIPPEVICQAPWLPAENDSWHLTYDGYALTSGNRDLNWQYEFMMHPGRHFEIYLQDADRRERWVFHNSTDADILYVASEAYVDAACRNIPLQNRNQIYDTETGITWQREMRGGNVYYRAITNVNLLAEGGQ